MPYLAIKQQLSNSQPKKSVPLMKKKKFARHTIKRFKKIKKVYQPLDRLLHICSQKQFAWIFQTYHLSRVCELI